MPKEERLSAVAKRRRLNSSLPTTCEPSVEIQRLQPPIKPTRQHRVSRLEKSEHIETADVRDDVNSFSALVDQDIVQFSNSREIEQIGHDSIRIRLSKGQKCLIVGRYSLWIKDGTIDCYGARLDPSIQLHHVFTVPGFDVPAIVALTDLVEFEVFSQPEQIPKCLGIAYYKWSIPGGDNTFQTSFCVHAYTNTDEGGSVSNFKAFDASLLKEVYQRIHRCNTIVAKTLPPTILVCGKQFVGTNTVTTHIINNILTAKKATRPKTFDEGLLFLDLEPEMPAFTPPGTISLVHIRKPILGATFAYPGLAESSNKTGPCAIIKMCHLDENDSTPRYAKFDTLFSYITQLRQTKYQHCPVIIKARSWLEQMDSAHITTIAKLFDTSFVICFGPEDGSNSGQLGTRIATETDCLPVISLPLTNSKDPPLNIQHRLHLVSYFYFSKYRFGRPYWFTLPLELGLDQQVWLSYGSETDLISGVSLTETHLSSFELADALRGRLVAILLKRHTDKERQQMNGSKDLQTSTQLENSGLETSSVPHHNCVGLGMIVAFSTDGRQICLLTPVSGAILESHQQDGGKLELVALEAEPEGRFDTTWVQVELETAVEGHKARKVIYNRVYDMAQKSVVCSK